MDNHATNSQRFCTFAGKGLSIMYDQIREDIFYIMLYAIVTALAMLASCYLLFRQGNAFAKDVMPPIRLRRESCVVHVADIFPHLRR